MKIILDNIIFSLQYGGGASVVWSEHISRILNDKRFESHFLEYDNSVNNVFRKNLLIPENSLTTKSSKLLKLARYVDVKGDKMEPYIFHSSHYRIDKNVFAKNVTTVHDFVYEKYVKGIRQKVHSLQKWNSIKKADAVICISESTKKDLLHYIPDMDENKLFVVHNGVSDTFRQIEPDEYNLEIPFETRAYALYIGYRHVPYKNFNTAVQICKNLNIPLITIGGEPIDKKEILIMEEQLGIGHFISLRGINNSDLNELYNRAFVLLYPSLYEGFGIPVIEAQRCGCPVICMQSSSIPEIVGNSDLCVQPDSSLDSICERVKLLYNNEYRNKEINQGLVNSQRFSWDNTYTKTIDVYNSLINM